MCGAILVEESLFRFGSVVVLARIGNLVESSTLTVSIFDHEPTVVLFDLIEPAAQEVTVQTERVSHFTGVLEFVQPAQLNPRISAMLMRLLPVRRCERQL